MKNSGDLGRKESRETMGEEGEGERIMGVASRGCQSFSLSLRSGRTIARAGHKKRNNTKRRVL